ncbi:MAG TPA: hypothetical protein VGM96_09450 [Reyranella sp.]|jgi:hypothetical protein
MVRKVGRAQLIGIAAILALFFAAEFALHGFEGPPREQAQASHR